MANLGQDTIEAIRNWVQDREKLTRDLRDHLQAAQHRMKQFADKHRVDCQFKVVDVVYLKLQPYRQITMAVRRNLKLSSRYYGPFEILERVGPIAYKLRLPEGSHVHPVFYVSLVKRSPKVERLVIPTAPLTWDEGRLLAKPEKIIDRRIVCQGNQVATQVLVKWSNLPEEYSTWEDYKFSNRSFQRLILEGKDRF